MTTSSDPTARLAALPKGRMTSEFTVWCHHCAEWWQTAEAHGRKRAGQLAKDKGWAYTRAFGWLCPECEGK